VANSLIEPEKPPSLANSIIDAKLQGQRLTYKRKNKNYNSKAPMYIP